MPGPRDGNKRSWHPSESDWALACELASAREGGRDKAAWALLSQIEGSGSGDASYDDGHGVRDAAGDLWGVYGDTDELVIGTHDVESVADAEALLELLAPTVKTLRDTSPADPACIRWGRTDGELRFDVYSLVDGEQRALGLARARGERTIRRLSDDADVEVSYEGSGWCDFSSESWGHYMRIRHHLI